MRCHDCGEEVSQVRGDPVFIEDGRNVGGDGKFRCDPCYWPWLDALVSKRAKGMKKKWDEEAKEGKTEYEKSLKGYKRTNDRIFKVFGKRGRRAKTVEE